MNYSELPYYRGFQLIQKQANYSGLLLTGPDALQYATQTPIFERAEMRFTRSGVLICLILSTMVMACSMKDSGVEQVKAMSEELYAALKQQDYDKALSLYSDDFFAMHPRDNWKAFLGEVHEKLGNLKRFRVDESQVDTIFSGRRFLYVFVVEYERGNTTDTVVFKKKVDEDEIRIVQHQVESSQL
jgi:hypothetical protein